MIGRPSAARDIGKEEFQGVAIASNRSWPQAFLGLQVVLEKSEDCLTDTRSLHPSFRSHHLEALSGLMKQVLGDGQIYGGRIGVDMTEERGEAHQFAVWIDALSIPAK